MPGVGVCAPFDLSGKHGQKRLGSVQCLDLRFLVYAQNHAILRRIHVKTDDVHDLLYEEWISGQREGLAPMGLQAETLPNAIERRYRTSCRSVNNAKKRSTRFIHDEYVGVKWA